MITVTLKSNSMFLERNYGLSFVAENIYAPNYRIYIRENIKYYEISFYADPEKNGQMRINLVSINGADDDVKYSGMNVYTANSTEYTYVSVASMETAMRLAGQYVDPGVICTEDSYEPFTDPGRTRRYYN